MQVPDPNADDAPERLLKIARRLFDAAALPPDIDAVWWPRFVDMAPRLSNGTGRARRASRPGTRNSPPAAPKVASTGVTLRGRADRIDARPAGVADILDFKTGSSPSKGQAHTLLSPQLALEGALLMHGAFEELGKLTPSELAYVRLRPNGQVEEESILEYNRQPRTADDLSHDAWQRPRKAAGALQFSVLRLSVAGAALPRRRHERLLRPPRPHARNGRLASMANQEAGNEPAPHHPAGDNRAPAPGLRSGSVGVGFGQCRLGQDACPVTARHPAGFCQAAIPRASLCLTYTRAAAANMSRRVFDTLAAWTRLDDAELEEKISGSGRAFTYTPA